MKTLTCPECGVTFAKKRNNQVYCSPKCAKAHDTRARREGWRRLHGGYDAFSATAPVSFDKLSRAKIKPANTSDIRWRIELRRRAMAQRYGAQCLDFAADPDRL